MPAACTVIRTRSFTGAITGLLNGDNITATYSTTATPASAVGTYPPSRLRWWIQRGSSATNTVTANNGTLTITPAPLTVTAANATIAFFRWSDSDSDWHDHGNQEPTQTSLPPTAPRPQRPVHSSYVTDLTGKDAVLVADTALQKKPEPVIDSVKTN